MKKLRDLSETQMYESIYAPVQSYKDKSGKVYKFQHVVEEDKLLRKQLFKKETRCYRFFKPIWMKLFANFAEEWFFLAILGIIVAFISYGIDKGNLLCNACRGWLFKDLADNIWAKYFAWISLPVCLCMFSAGFVKILAPEASIGSGIPEMKTILRGGEVKNFLTYRALIAKSIGIISTLGSGMPLGREGPLIHMSGCVVTLLGRLTSFQGIYQNESRRVEMLAAACAVGVACTFGAPIGGVLLSVEITTSYFAVRNYWRGFCAAIWGATVYRLLLVWIEGVESVTVLFKTSFYVDTPWAAQELFAFSVLGIICGLGSAYYMRLKVQFGRFLKKNQKISFIKNNYPFLYTGVVAAIVSSIMFPPGIGQFLGGGVPYAAQVKNMFANFTWTADNLTINQQNVLKNWQTDQTGLYLHLVCLIAFNFVCSILASTMPIPNGCFIPTFRMGAAIGRIMGELMHAWYPNGLSYYGRITRIIPGGYATVGAAAFTGGVTQTMSVAIIVLEMTSQITHTIPILIAVLIANGIAQTLGPSLYNSVIKAKNLPYLPDILPGDNAIYSVYVEDFMRRNVPHVYQNITYEQLKNVLVSHPKLNSFPLVNNQFKMVLLGSIRRLELVRLIENQVGIGRKLMPMSLGECEKYADHKEVEDENELTTNEAYQIKKPPLPLPSAPATPISSSPSSGRICDLPHTLRTRWELDQLSAPVDFKQCRIDPAPFQLVERTSLLKVHALFSMVGVNLAYVTSIGRLIGVVTLDELRKAIQDVRNGDLKPNGDYFVVDEDEKNENV